MKVVVLRNFPSLTKLPLTNRELMREIGLLARERIYRRTVSGRDEHDQPFRPYSAAYGRRKSQELGKTTVNLQVSGAMLNAMRVVRVTDTEVDIGFTA